MTRYRCPASPIAPDGSAHTVLGCGSWNTTEPDEEGIVDCCDCGIWFNAEREPELETREEDDEVKSPF